jgi:hypothetical protein
MNSQINMQESESSAATENSSEKIPQAVSTCFVV